MTKGTNKSRKPSRRSILGGGAALLGALYGGKDPSARADQAQLSLPARAPEAPPPGYNILFVLVDQEHFFEKWPFPAPGREYLKKYATTFLNHQGATQVCSSRAPSFHILSTRSRAHSPRADAYREQQHLPLMVSLNAKLNARIGEEVGVDDGSFLPLLDRPLVPD